MTTTQEIDAAIKAVRSVAHGHGLHPETRKHLEHAAAHLREAWLFEDDQQGQTAKATSEAVLGFYRLQDALHKKEAA